jgi:hypothetical protein
VKGLRDLPHGNGSARGGKGSGRIEESTTCRLVRGLHVWEDLCQTRFLVCEPRAKPSWLAEEGAPEKARAYDHPGHSEI